MTASRPRSSSRSAPTMSMRGMPPDGKSLIDCGVHIAKDMVRFVSWFFTIREASIQWATLRTARRRLPRSGRMHQAMERGFRRVRYRLGMGMAARPAASHEEIDMFMSAKCDAYVRVRMRYAGYHEPTTGLAALEEVIAAAAETGAPLHVVHVTSMGFRNTRELLRHESPVPANTGWMSPRSVIPTPRVALRCSPRSSTPGGRKLRGSPTMTSSGWRLASG